MSVLSLRWFEGMNEGTVELLGWGTDKTFVLGINFDTRLFLFISVFAFSKHVKKYVLR